MCLIFLSGHAFHANIKIKESPSCCYCHFWLNVFPPYKPGTGLSDSKGHRKRVLGINVDYKKLCYLHQGKYVQVHQED